ncbi:MAG: glutaredoxin family protein [Thermoanaerobaculia bacterium]
MIQLRLYTRRECHLCEEMQDVVTRASEGFSVRLEVVDVDLDSELLGHFGEEVPVLLVNGEKFAKYRIGETRLRWKLTREALRER